MDYRHVRETLRLARTRAAIEGPDGVRVGMTLDEAAAAARMNRATIHSIENVKREPDLKPKLETLEQLAQAYGLTLSLRVDGGAPILVRSAPGLGARDDRGTLPISKKEAERIAANVFWEFAQGLIRQDRGDPEPADRQTAHPSGMAAEQSHVDRASRELPPELQAKRRSTKKRKRKRKRP